MKISKGSDGKQGQIAVVEELPDNIYSIRFILESLGYKVASVTPQQDYIEGIRRMKPDLIIVDMLIPGKRGLEVIEDLVNSDMRGAPSMAITADAVAIEEKELRRLGFGDVLNKPYTVTQLQEKLKKYLS